MVPDVESFYGLTFNTAFLTSSRDTDLKWKLSGTTSGLFYFHYSNDFIFIMLIIYDFHIFFVKD